MQATRALLGAAVVLGLAVALAPRSRAEDKPRVPHGLAGVGLTQAKVDAAIEKGKQFLVTQLNNDPDGDGPYAMGSEDVLMAVALSHTDALKKDRKLARRILAGLYQHEAGKTYESACIIMALEHLGARLHKDRVADLAQLFLEQQMAGENGDGGWNYGDTAEVTKRTPPELPTDAVIEVTGGVPIASKGASLAKLARKGPGGDGTGDNSTSQFGILGVHSATTQGLEVPQQTWDLALKHFATNQRDDGAWGYTDNASEPSGSMTCAGITGLAIALHHTGQDPAKDARIQKGLAWLAKYFSFDGNLKQVEDKIQPYPANHSYYVYGIERVGVLLGTEFVGSHEWYPEGAKWLVEHQQEDGSWLTDAGTNLDTAFALMFLTRATTPLAAPKGGQGTLRTSVASTAEQAAEKTGLYFILDASDSMNDKIGGRSKWEIVKDAAKKIVKKLPDDALVGLRVYGHNPSNPRKVDERETELLMPVARLDRAKFESIVDHVKPQGRTPIAMSFDRTSTDLGSSPACRVLLLSDGAETGGGDPVKSATGLAANPKCLGIDCLGFDIVSEPKARAQLQEVARIGKGRYTESEDPEVLARAGARTGVEYVLLDSAGKELARGTLGDERPLPEGEYRIRVSVNEKPFEAGLWIDTGVETRATVHPERAPAK